MFFSTNTSCSFCKQPCRSCSGTEANCTSCFKNSSIPNLFVNQCIDTCPKGYVSIDGICEKCKSPCALCEGTPDHCISCDGTGGTKYVHDDQCWADCPPGTRHNAENLTCFACNEGCDLCDIQDINKCLRCTAPALVYDGSCISECPIGWVVNEEGVACRPWQLSDLGIIYFPFLICGAIFTAIILLGQLKKRAYLDKTTNKMDKRSF